MNRLHICILLSVQWLLICGCATVQPTPPNVLIDPRLKDMVELFESTYEVKVNFPVRVGVIAKPPKMKEPPAGQCDPAVGIVIASDIVSIEYYDLVEEVVFHELGHCFFGREHKNAKIKSGAMKDCAESVMTSKQMLSYNHCWQTFKSHYIHELVTPGLCQAKNVVGGVCPTKYNANPQFNHVQEFGGGMQPSRFYRSPP